MFVEEIREKAAKIRNSQEYRVWRSAVFERDRRKCKACGARQNVVNGVKLEADHILPFMLYPEKMFDVDNGRTLCNGCHRKTSTYGNSFAHRKAHTEVIHPFLQGDYLRKIKCLPTTIEFNGQVHALQIRYKTINKTWVAGYGPQSRIPQLPSWSTESYSADEAIDSLLAGLKYLGRTN